MGKMEWLAACPVCSKKHIGDTTQEVDMWQIQHLRSHGIIVERTDDKG